MLAPQNEVAQALQDGTFTLQPNGKYLCVCKSEILKSSIKNHLATAKHKMATQKLPKETKRSNHLEKTRNTAKSMLAPRNEVAQALQDGTFTLQPNGKYLCVCKSEILKSSIKNHLATAKHKEMATTHMRSRTGREERTGSEGKLSRNEMQGATPMFKKQVKFSTASAPRVNGMVPVAREREMRPSDHHRQNYAKKEKSRKSETREPCPVEEGDSDTGDSEEEVGLSQGEDEGEEEEEEISQGEEEQRQEEEEEEQSQEEEEEQSQEEEEEEQSQEEEEEQSQEEEEEEQSQEEEEEEQSQEEEDEQSQEEEEKEQSQELSEEESQQSKGGDNRDLSTSTAPYRMASQPRGNVYIFNYKFAGKHNYREGAEHDSETIQATFTNMGYRVFTKESLSRRATLMELKLIRDEASIRDVDSMIMFFLSHGKGVRDFLTEDGLSLCLSRIHQMFTDAQCPALRGKPKIFFTNFCRKGGFETCPVFEASDPPRDMVTIHASGEGIDALRNTAFGTYFIRNLCQVLQEHAGKKSLRDIYLELDRSAAERGGTQPMWEDFVFRNFYFSPTKTKTSSM
ncbi:nucleolin-like isoform X2 [Penaeus monodon]|uniref:nucleolin-like isoform X2 n=1 Tax=Penaeus monodon TaxID=6687 RepID=UPI0018A76BDC|nr:nucleolin-like isoform X2 [Penaeus monodon]XP_037796836.1 nucleolin-like isoform X2 [Penaeus monodon]